MPDSDKTVVSSSRWLGVLVLGLLLAVLLGLLLRLVFGAAVVRDETRLLTPSSHIALGQKNPTGEPVLVSSPAPAKNVIVVMADGLGFNHVAAARLALRNDAAPLSFELLPITGWHYPFPAVGLRTDSAASATAIATGVATLNGAVATDSDGHDVESLLDHAHHMGKKIGIVTDSYIWDATPGAFGSHATDREDVMKLLQGFADSNLDLLFGELEDVAPDSDKWQAQVAVLKRRFLIAENAEQLEKIAGDAEPIATAFPEHQVEDSTSTPNLRRLTEIALGRLSRGSEGFVLMVESEEPDSASHDRDFDRLVRGLDSLDHTIQTVLDFAAGDGQTLVVVTGDHETGGLTLHPAGGNTAARVRWGSDDHTVSPIPIYAGGPGAAAFSGVKHNRELFSALQAALSTPAQSADKKPSDP